MGVYYKVANFTKKEIIDGYSAKLGEWDGNAFDQAVVVNYLINNKDFPMQMKFIADESGEWDECADAGFKDVTAEIIYCMFERGYFGDYNKHIWNTPYIMRYILSKFQDSGMETDFHEICDKTPEFAKFREEMVLVELER
jgi:hypothetical protein